MIAWLIVFVYGEPDGPVGYQWEELALPGALRSCHRGQLDIYFRALQLGNVNQVAPIDKSSTVLTMLLAFVLLGEPLTRECCWAWSCS